MCVCVCARVCARTSICEKQRPHFDFLLLFCSVMTLNCSRNSLNWNQMQVCDFFSLSQNHLQKIITKMVKLIVTEDVSISCGVKCYKRLKRGFGRDWPDWRWYVIIHSAYGRIIFMFLCRNSWFQAHYTQMDLHVAGIVRPFCHRALGRTHQWTWCQGAGRWCAAWEWPHLLPHSCQQGTENCI